MSARPAFKAGSWYPAAPSALRRDIAKYLRQADCKASRPAIAGIVPHAGLAYSGPVAAKVYAWLAAANKEVETFVIFGAVHTMHLRKPAIWQAGVWQTPLGDIAVDEELASAIAASGAAEFDDRPHLGDNAIELQTPFIKHAFPNAQIVPIAVPPNAAAAPLGITTWEICKKIDRGAIALGSTDLTHYGDAFGCMPAGIGEPALAWARRNDCKLLGLMASLAAEEVVPTAAHDHSACGAGAAAAATAFARAAGCEGGIILAQTTSHDIMPADTAAHFVGYGAIIFPQSKL